jgi:hypothetical protein
LIFLALVAGTLLLYPLGVSLGVPWLLPLMNALPAYVVMAGRLSRRDRKGAVLAMLCWAAALAVGATLTFALWPSDPGAVVIHGPAYRAEMFHWIRTSEGSEGVPSLFIPQHLLHLALFVALSLASASLASIVMGAVMMNYMAYYVASLARAGVPTWAVVALGWQPYALCRVAAFSILGALLAEPLLSRLLRYRYEGLASARPYLLWAAGGLAADWIVKAAVAPQWGRWLQALLPSG